MVIIIVNRVKSKEKKGKHEFNLVLCYNVDHEQKMKKQLGTKLES